MTTLYFRHSFVHEQAISKLDGLSYSEKDWEIAQQYVQDFSKYWEQHNDQVFGMSEKLGFRFADFWIAYFIRPRDNMVPYSDPLTLFIDRDFDKTTAILVHELVHVLLTYPDHEQIAIDTMKLIRAKTPNTSLNIQVEIPAAILSRTILQEIFGKEKTKILQERERLFPVLGEAWKIIDKSQTLEEENPFIGMEKLNI